MLRIHLFGRIRVAFADEPSEVNIPPTAQRVLAFLLLQPHRFYQREVLAALCWGERSEEQARACLNTTLWRLRRSLEPESTGESTYLITTASGEVGFNWQCDHWLDLTIFETCATRLLAQPPQSLGTEQVHMLESILPLYAGDLFEGLYDDWAIQERERLLTYYLDCLAHLMRYHRHQGAYDQSLRFGQLLLRRDPLREEIHREVMRLHWQAGQRSLAIHQYENCQKLLAEELGISPMPETDTLYTQLLSGVEPPPTAPVNGSTALRNEPNGPPPQFDEVFQQLVQAMQKLDAAREDLGHAMQQVERLYAEAVRHG